MNSLFKIVKAIAAAIGALIATWGLVVADENISFEEIGALKVAAMAVFTALITFVAPRNQE